MIRESENQENLSSESENDVTDFNLINKSHALKIRLDPMDFDYFTTIIRSDDVSRYDSVQYKPFRKVKCKKKVNPVDFIDKKIEDVMQSQVSSYEFSSLVVKLLTSLCRSEYSFSIDSGYFQTCFFINIFFNK